VGMPFGAVRRRKGNIKAGLRQIGYEDDVPRNCPDPEDVRTVSLQKNWDLPSNTASCDGFISSTLCNVIMLFLQFFDSHLHTNQLGRCGTFLDIYTVKN